MNIDEIVSKMTLEEKIDFCTGADFWNSKAMQKLGIKSIKMSDGPHGLRCQAEKADMIGINESIPSTCFPTAVTAGATWNEELYAKEGEAIAKEALSNGVDVVLGPGCNIKRNPLCGRNFEYLSEDPYIAGKMAAAFIKGQQSTGVSSSLKHFAANNQEYKRQNSDSLIDDRALREIYLSAFETAVKEGKPDTVMCAYNKINGVHCSDNKWLLTDVLRDEWGFDGMVVTDWGALNDRIEGFKAGCDLNMPGGSEFMKKATIDAVKSGKLDESGIDKSVKRILKLVQKSANHQKQDFSADEHNELARIIAEQGAVLLKNDEHLLPICENDIVLIGYMAKHFRYQGSGSSHINPTKVTSLTDALPNTEYIECCNSDGDMTDKQLAAAKNAAKAAKVAVVVAGLPDIYESEAIDRESMALPDGHNKMIEAVASANPNTVVVLLGGSAMELPWIDRVKAVLYMGLSGQAGGQAAANLLTGKATPSGKLTESWPISYDDVISKDTFGKRNAEYRESIYVGYRYYDKAKKAVRFPFGFGLSYTEFSYSDLTVENNIVTVTVTNIGKTAGAEVVQLYIAPPNDSVYRPIRELKGFARVELAPNESRQIRFVLNNRCFAVWNSGWVTLSGEYQIQIGSSSRDIRLSAPLYIDGKALTAPSWQKGSWYDTLDGAPSRETWEKAMGRPVPIAPEPKKGSFTMDNSCLEMKDSSFVMKIQYAVTERIIAKSYGGKRDYSNPAFKMTMICATDCPLRSVIINSNGSMNDKTAHGLLEMANGHFIKGIVRMIKG